MSNIREVLEDLQQQAFDQEGLADSCIDEAELAIQQLIDDAVRKARYDELRLVDAAYHAQIEMKTELSVNELNDMGVDTVTIDDPRTQNDLFRHVQHRLAELSDQLNNMKGE